MEDILSNYLFTWIGSSIDINAKYDYGNFEIISLCQIINGIIEYDIERGDLDPYETIHKETYEEALEILKKENKL